jgi:hypothetical protein
MDTAFYRDALFVGMASNAFKLGTVLHVGWFWPRLTGCSLLYHGDSIEAINFGRVTAVDDFDASRIAPPDYLLHQSNTTCFYVLRRANGCGDTERTSSASVKVVIDSNGDLAQLVPNSIFTVRTEVVQGNRAKLTWFYCPIEQQSPPTRFNIYTDDGTGQIDYQNAIAQIEYRGRKFYSFNSDKLPAGKYLFAIKVQDENGIEDNSLAVLSIEINDINNSLLQFVGVRPL